jgi:hypothetical protein
VSGVGTPSERADGRTDGGGRFLTVGWTRLDRAGLLPTSPAADSPRALTVGWTPTLGTVWYPADAPQDPATGVAPPRV